MKRIAIISDLHCGHRAGLTPPDWQYRDTGQHEKWGEIQGRVWGWYASTVAGIGKVDALIVNGDAIDGKGERSGGSELLTADRDDQVEMAAACVGAWQADRTIIMGGTPYHTGRDEDWEKVLASELGCKFALHEFVEVDGVTFDIRHKVGGSVIPHGRYTATQRAALWGRLWAARGIQPEAQVVIRSHVHYYGFSGGSDGVAMTTPALQVYSNFGSRECEGTNDVGLVVFDCEDGGYRWKAHILGMKWAAASSVTI